MELYLDNASTTRVFDEVVKEMERCMKTIYGNPSSQHQKGEKALEEIMKAKKNIAHEINSKPEEVYFTSGGTESNNIALLGLERNNRKKVIISEAEHSSINNVAEELERRGFVLVKIKLNNGGLVDFKMLEREIDEDTLIVSIMHVNNVIGTIQDIRKIGEMCRKRGAYFHTDAVQSFGKIEIDVKKMNIDMLSASAHKIGGPKGIGFIYVKNGIKINPLIYGGGQERGLRSGTENVPGICGFSKALEIARKIDKKKVRKERDYLASELEKISGRINGDRDKRIWGNIHVSFSGIDAEMLVYHLSRTKIYVSSGSACESKRGEEDRVLKSIGISGNKDSIRISFFEPVSHADLSRVVKEIKRGIDIQRFG